MLGLSILTAPARQCPSQHALCNSPWHTVACAPVLCITLQLNMCSRSHNLQSCLEPLSVACLSVHCGLAHWHEPWTFFDQPRCSHFSFSLAATTPSFCWSPLTSAWAASHQSQSGEHSGLQPWLLGRTLALLACFSS